MHFPSIYFGFLFESPLDRPIRSSKVRPTPLGTSSGVVGALPVIPFGALNRNPSNPTACRGKWRIKHFRETKNLDSIRETAETQKLQIWRGNRTFSQFIISTWHILIGRSTFTELWSDGHQYAKFEKKLRTGREFVDTWHAQLQKSWTKFHVLRSNILQQKQNWPISDRCSMLNLRESEVEAPNPW